MPDGLTSLGPYQVGSELPPVNWAAASRFGKRPPKPLDTSSIDDAIAKTQKELQDNAAALGPVMGDLGDIEKKINSLGPLPVEDPFAIKKAESRQAQTELEKRIELMQSQGARHFQPGKLDTSSLGPYPQSPNLPIPTRPEAKVSPVASLLAGLGGVIAPRAAPHLAAAAVRGAVQRANQTYADALRDHEMKLDDLDRHHRDELAARNEALRLIEDNFDREERGRMANFLADGKWQEAIDSLKATKAGQDVLSADLTGLSRDATNRLKLAQQLAMLRDSQDVGLKKAKLIQDQKKFLTEQRTKLEEAKARVMDHHDSMLAAADQREMLNRIRAFQYGGQIGPDGMVTPTPRAQLPPAQQAKIAADEARARNSASLADLHRQNIQRVKEGKPVDITKSTPAERLALAELAGAKQTYETTVKARSDFMKNPKNAGKAKKRTPDYVALETAESNAAKAYQDADSRAIAATSGTVRTVGKSKSSQKTVNGFTITPH